jgi:fatty acid desaturase
MQQKNIGNKQKKVINNFLVLLTSQIIIFLILNHSLFLYLILWIIPLFTANMFLMRVRGIAEHGMPSQLDIIPEDGVTGNILTRTLNSKHSSTNFLTKCIENVLIGTLSIKYHLEHHLVPNVPHYNLQKLHKILNLYSIDELRNNYKSGYFSALFQFNKT